MLKLIGCLAAVASLSGCASIVSGQNQSLSLVSNSSNGAVIGASCSLVNDKGQWFATTPGTVTVRRSFSDLAVSCQHPTSAGVAQVKSATKGMAFGNLLFGGVIGVGVDVATGAAYDYPELISVQMMSLAAIDPATLAVPLPPLTSSTDPRLLNASAVVGTAAAAAPVTAAVSLPTPPATAPALAQPAPQVKATAQAGVDSWAVERMREVKACHSAPRAVLNAKGAGFENYNVTCSSGDVLAVRCELGNCRILR